MFNILLIFLGSGLGGIFRYGVSNSIYWLLGKHFPYGTLVVNASGCFLMGLLFAVILKRYNGIETQLRSLLLIGFLGGYTTFSSFSIETLMLIEKSVWGSAALNIFLSISLCIILTWLGLLGGGQL